MNKIILLLALMLTGFLSKSAQAQVDFRVNISTQPIWGPVGYDHVEYYYLPDIQAYYYVPTHKYVYEENGRWISRSHLPRRYGNYDMYGGRKVVMNEDRPYMRHRENMERYGHHERSNQQSIRDSRESRYFENRNHPQHHAWKRDQRNERRNHGHENNNGNEHGNGHGNGNGHDPEDKDHGQNGQDHDHGNRHD